jgi:hypothetical protein
MPAVIPAGIDTGIAADIFCPRRYPRVLRGQKVSAAMPADSVFVNVHVSSRMYCRGHFSIYRIATSLPANERWELRHAQWAWAFTAAKEKMSDKRSVDLVKLIELVRDNKILWAVAVLRWGRGGTGPPNVGQAPPKIFGQLNFFLETGNQEIIELSILSHNSCYLTWFVTTILVTHE